MEASKEDDAPVVFLDRTARATRGKRMTKLLDDEVEEDETFWNQDALKEDENDDNYQEEAEAPDEFDSDFDDDEPEPDNEAENEAMERRPPRKRLIFPGKTLPKKKKKKDLSKLDNEPSSKDEKPNEQTTTTPEHHDVPDEVEEERVVRKSTRTSVIVRQAERDAIRAALQATMKPIKRKKEGEEKKMSQEEMLLEAAQTEIMNLRNLERVLAREEEVKKRAAVSKAVYSGPQIRFSSKDGKLICSDPHRSCTYLEFKGLSFHSQLSTTPIPYPEKACCVVTGLPAKYRDPKTGKPYATIEAFKIIRQRFEEENSKNLNKEMDMGALFNALKGKGFVNRRKRSPFFAIKKTTTHFSYFPPPCRIPMFDIDDSD
ncbi:SWR1 complex subunit 2 [Linum perenne]